MLWERRLAHMCCARSGTQTISGKRMLRMDGLPRTSEKRLRSTALCSTEKGESSNAVASLRRLPSASVRRWCAVSAYLV